jgi:hypothetical protein
MGTRLSGPGRQPVSSSTSLAAACAGPSPGSARPTGTSQPQVSVMNRCRHRREVSRNGRSSACGALPVRAAQLGVPVSQGPGGSHRHAEDVIGPFG